jgi:hypothetical protein
MIVGPSSGHNRPPNGILGLLCREHFPGLIEFAGKMEPAYSFDHYTSAADMPDRNDRVFNNKAEQGKQELWVRLPPNTLLNTSDSIDNFEILNGYILCVCRISLDACRDWRLGRMWWLPITIKNSWWTCTTRRASSAS